MKQLHFQLMLFGNLAYSLINNDSQFGLVNSETYYERSFLPWRCPLCSQ